MTFIQFLADAIDPEAAYEHNTANSGQLKVGKLMLEDRDATYVEEALWSIGRIRPQPLPMAGCKNESLHALKPIQAEMCPTVRRSKGVFGGKWYRGRRRWG